MDFNKNLLLIVSLSSLLLFGHAVPSSRSLASVSPSSAPGPASESDTMTLLSSSLFFSSSAPGPAPESRTVSLLGSLFSETGEDVAQQAEYIKPEIAEFCSGTENPALCSETVAPFLQGSFDPIKALETEIEATLNQTLKVSGIIANTLSDSSTAKNALDALDICKTQYDSIIDTIKESVDLLSQQNVVDAYYKFSSVLSDRSACEDAFLESPGVDIPFADDSVALSQLGGNCLAIMDGIVNHGIQF